MIYKHATHTQGNDDGVDNTQWTGGGRGSVDYGDIRLCLQRRDNDHIWSSWSYRVFCYVVVMRLRIPDWSQTYFFQQENASTPLFREQ